MMASAAAAGTPREQASTYELFIGVMTIYSLADMLLLVFVNTGPVHDILYGADVLFCLIFLCDFAITLYRSPSKRGYLLPDGILDLLGSIPAAGILRIFRVFRLRRVYRVMQASGPRAIARDFLARRAEAALYLIIVLAMLVLTIGSSLVVIAEQNAPNANIRTGGDAFWWAFVTITTVGYGDYFPVTPTGRLVAMTTMAVGIGIFGVLTSFLSTAMLAPKKSEPTAEPAPSTAPEPAADDAGAASTVDQAAVPTPAPAAAVPASAAPAPAAQIAASGAASEWHEFPILASEVAALRREIAELRATLGTDGRGRGDPAPNGERAADTVATGSTPG